MLRCPGCGELVSVWAARCPSCGTGTSEAEELDVEAEDPASDDRSEAADLSEDLPVTTPELEAETAPHAEDAVVTTRRWYRDRLALAALVTVSAAVVSGGIVAGLEATSTPKRASGNVTFSPALRDLAGQVVAMSYSGNVEVSRPDGQAVVSLPRLGRFQDPSVSVAPDGRLFTIDTEGRLMAVISDQPVTAAVNVKIDPPISDIGPDPFADKDQALLVVGPNAAAISLLVLGTGQVLHLGIPIVEPGRQSVRSAEADAISGDPRSLGAFASVLAPEQPPLSPTGRYAGLVDTRVELYRYGQPPVVVTTAAQLNAEVGSNPSTPDHLVVYPSPTGDELAVVLDPESGSDPNSAMVVVDRQGRLLGQVGAGEGPIEYSPPAWSPDGRSLAYTTLGSRGTALAIWSPGRTPTERLTPLPGSDFTSCLWSPRGSDVLCTTTGSPGNVTGIWIVGAAHSGPLYIEHTSAMPIAWLLPAGH